MYVMIEQICIDWDSMKHNWVACELWTIISRCAQVSLYFSNIILKMVGKQGLSESSIYESVRRHMPEDHSLENLKHYVYLKTHLPGRYLNLIGET
jgi:hypothetical protein